MTLTLTEAMVLAAAQHLHERDARRTGDAAEPWELLPTADRERHYAEGRELVELIWAVMPRPVLIALPPSGDDIAEIQRVWRETAGHHAMPLMIHRPEPDELLHQALTRAVAPVPSTKGLNPQERAQRLHAELERRIADAKRVLHPFRRGKEA